MDEKPKSGRAGAVAQRRQPDPSRLAHARLADEFSNDELDQLAFDLGFKDGKLWADDATIDERARALTIAMVNRGRLAELIGEIERLRP